jgi:hypothetical protein
MLASSDRSRLRAKVSASGAEVAGDAQARRPVGRVSEPDAGAVVEVPREVVIAELLGLCDGFVRSAGPVVRAELLAFLISRGLSPGTALGWFVDVLSMTAAAAERDVAAAGSGNCHGP